jgi:hypothetical protein
MSHYLSPHLSIITYPLPIFPSFHHACFLFHSLFSICPSHYLFHCLSFRLFIMHAFYSIPCFPSVHHITLSTACLSAFPSCMFSIPFPVFHLSITLPVPLRVFPCFHHAFFLFHSLFSICPSHYLVHCLSFSLSIVHVFYSIPCFPSVRHITCSTVRLSTFPSCMLSLPFPVFHLSSTSPVPLPDFPHFHHACFLFHSLFSICPSHYLFHGLTFRLSIMHAFNSIPYFPPVHHITCSTA